MVGDGERDEAAVLLGSADGKLRKKKEIEHNKTENQLKIFGICEVYDVVMRFRCGSFSYCLILSLPPRALLF